MHRREEEKKRKFPQEPLKGREEGDTLRTPSIFSFPEGSRKPSREREPATRAVQKGDGSLTFKLGRGKRS